MPEENTVQTVTAEDLMPRYRKVSLMIGTYVMIMFVLRYFAVVINTTIAYTLKDTLDFTARYIIQVGFSGLFLQILPSIIGAIMFGYLKDNCRKLKAIYTIPKSNTRAIGNFSAVYGFAQIFNVITIIATYLLTSKADLTKKLNTVADQTTIGMGGAWMMFFMLVVIAPVFEEFVFRGVIQNALKPYGNGLAIFASGLLFGIFHGNFQQAFYTAAAGIALGYIANVTGSIVPTTIIHAIMNSLGGIMILLMNTDSVQRYVLNGEKTDIPDRDMIWVAAYGIFMVCVMILIVIGFIAAVVKIKQIKRYKTKKVWGEIGNGKKVSMLVFSVPMILSAVMIVDTFGGFTSGLIAGLFRGE